MADGRTAAVLLACCLAFAGADAAPRGAVDGLWYTEDRGGVISVQPCGPALCGIIVGLSDWPANGDVKRDWRGRPQCHSVLLADLVLHDDARWHGTVTNPEDGKTYSAEVWLPADGVLRLRGYIGLPLLGSTQRWPPFDGQVRPDCHFPP
jgi:uncharacterized protein (DUF2147 family)